MIKPEQPQNEAERLAALREYAILDTGPEDAYDDITRIASSICDTPISLVSLIDAHRQWFKSKVGLDASETPRELAFCAHAILEPEKMLVVEDAHEDPRFFDNPLVTGQPVVRFYAGMPSVTPAGMPLGTLCVIDHEPRKLDAEQIETLAALARQVVSQLELRKSCDRLTVLTDDLTRANSDLKDFNHMAAHDLQEPLRKILSFSRFLEKDLGDDLPERAEKDLGFIVDAASRMERLVSDLLELSRTGTSELKRAEVSMSECVQSALDALSLRIRESDAEVIVEDLPVVRGDRTLITQVFQNLIGNALKFVKDEKPRVEVTCDHDEGAHVIAVSDNGIGIDPARADQIFTPFKRLHGRSEFEGTGIGLSITRKAVERHGGRIWVKSEKGQGSCFNFTLPG